MVKRNVAGIILVVWVSVILAGTARALPPEPKDWEAQIKLYGWLTWLQTKVKVGGAETTLDLDLGDVLDDLGWTVMGGVEGRYKRGLVLVDFFGAQLADGAKSNTQTFPFELPGPLAQNGELTVGPVKASTRLTTWFIDTKFGFRALSMPISKLTGSPESPEDQRRLDFDLLAGFRVWDVTAKIHTSIAPASLTVGGSPVQPPGILPGHDFGNIKLPGAILNGTSNTAEDNVDWLDPLVGFRLSGDVTDRISLFMLGDIGGWGVGTASNLTWQGMIGGSFALSESWLLTGAYRAIGVNRDAPITQTILYGPQLGVVYRF
jgi:hypothetical protein